jgi:hypothetical protein
MKSIAVTAQSIVIYDLLYRQNILLHLGDAPIAVRCQSFELLLLSRASPASKKHGRTGPSRYLTRLVPTCQAR